MKKLFLLISLGLVFAFASCSDDDDKYYDDNISAGGTMQLQGGTGGSMAINSVFVDFSSENQVSVERASWHLAFNCGSDFGVFLNNTLGSRVVPANEGHTVETALNSEENTTYKGALSLGMGNGSWDIVDNLDGTIAGTAIKEGKVYIYDSGDAALELYKISVTKKDNNTYTLKYALANSSQVTAVDVVKESAYDKVGVSLITGKTLKIQPSKGDWDIVWGRNTYKSGAMDVPFVISDVVFSNSGNGVQIATVLTQDVTYEAYAESNIAATTFSSDNDVIGTTWRAVKVNTTTATSETKAVTDRFYVIKDTSGNYYKLSFTAASEADGTERGKPEIEFQLVKEAE